MDSHVRSLGPAVALLVILALTAFPKPASAQPGFCGDCIGFVVAHVFGSITYSPLGERKCDNNGGCHFDWWTNGCNAHQVCWSGWTGGGDPEEPGGFPGEAADVLTADGLFQMVHDSDVASLTKALGRLTRWTLESDRVLNIFSCADVLIARITIPLDTDIAATPPPLPATH